MQLNNTTFSKVLLVIVLFLITTFAIAILGLQDIESRVRKDTANALNVVVETTHETHIIWIKDNKSSVEFTAKNPLMVSLVKQLLDEGMSAKEPRANSALKNLRHYFITSHNTLNHVGFFIITKDNINAASMRDGSLGRKNLITRHYPELLEKAFSGETVFVPPIESDVVFDDGSVRNRPTMFFVTPIMDKAGVRALFALQILPNRSFTRITQAGRIGKTGETYVFNKSGFMLTNSRFVSDLHRIGLITKEQDAILNIRVSDPGANMLNGFKPVLSPSDQALTVMAESAVSGKSGVNVSGYRDYRGQTVFGAWLWNEELGFGVTTEIDEKEALRSYELTKNTVQYIVLIMLSLSVLLALVIYWIEQKASKNLKSAYNELEHKTTELKALQGVVPICSYCKHIRNDEGSWDLLEQYFSDHLDAKFTHGICPSCLAKQKEKIQAEND
ncbi:MAG: hypothetical protein OEY36_03020 [Gammaproteobacteria bacterium]|nr:hypothetical protein [Gammaproteobacteria bacterium]